MRAAVLFSLPLTAILAAAVASAVPNLSDSPLIALTLRALIAVGVISALTLWAAFCVYMGFRTDIPFRSQQERW